jgi:hypothetical protein
MSRNVMDRLAEACPPHLSPDAPADPAPAVRAEMFRLMAGVAARSSAGRGIAYFDMGQVTDRAGRSGIGIGILQTAAPYVPGEFGLLVFDQGTGALVSEEQAHCKLPVTLRTVAADCAPQGYTQLLQIKAVPSLPHLPAGRG